MMDGGLDGCACLGGIDSTVCGGDAPVMQMKKGAALPSKLPEDHVPPKDR